MEDLEGRGPREGPPGVGGYPGDPGQLSTLIIKFWAIKPYASNKPQEYRPDIVTDENDNVVNAGYMYWLSFC